MFTEIFMQLLQNRNVTAYKLSRDTGISEALISNWKNGRQLPKYDSILLLCNYFNISADYLLGRTSNPINPNLTTEESSQNQNNEYEAATEISINNVNKPTDE